MFLTHENYHSIEADNEYISSHQVANFMDCPRKEIARLNGDYVQPDKRCFLLGQYVDVALLTPEKFEGWKRETDGILKKNGEPYADMLACDAMIESARSDKKFMAKLAGKHQVIFVGSIDGIQTKGMVDVILPEKERFVDLKTSKDFETTWDTELGYQVPWYEAFNYWRQLAFYQRLIRDNYGKNFLPAIAGITTQTPPAKMIVSFEDQHRLDREIDSIRALLPSIKAWKDGTEQPPACLKNSCDYCRGTKETEIIIAESVR